MMDGQTDGQREESDFIGCCPTNVKHPIMEDQKLVNLLENTSNKPSKFRTKNRLI